MANSKKRVKISDLKGIKLYNFLLKRLAEENQNRPKKQQIGINRRREIVSKQLYPQFKKEPKILAGSVNAAIRKIVTKLPPAEICNPLLLSEAYLAFVEYYEIDNHIRTVLPDCLDVKVNAGYLGKTKIFNTRNYSYNGDGVRKIIENIRKELEENKSGIAFFNGVVKLKPKKPNDGTPENYYVEYILYINNTPEADDTGVIYDVPKNEKRKTEKKVEKVRDYLSDKFYELQKEKRKRKRQREKNRPKTEKEIKALTDKEIKAALASYRNLLRLGAITKEQFEQQKAILMKLRK